MHSFGAKEWADKCEQLEATIADLRGQVKAAQKTISQHDAADSVLATRIRETESWNASLKQQNSALQQRVAQLEALKLGKEVGACEHRRIVKQAQRSLPAQPAQGGA